jgi:FixJ family two-component response regulator
MTMTDQPFDSAQPIVFVVDDDESVRKSVTRLLKAVGLRSETFGSGEEFLARERYEGVGCIVLDVRMPGLTGPDLQDELARVNYFMPIVFVTGHGSIPMGVTAMKKGAADFLQKPFDDDQLLEAVSKAIERHRDFKKTEAEKIDIREKMKLLTPREEEVLRYVVTGMLNKQIAYKLSIAEKTVKVHRGHITEKLGLSSVADLVRLADKIGLEPPGSDEPTHAQDPGKGPGVYPDHPPKA